MASPGGPPHGDADASSVMPPTAPSVAGEAQPAAPSSVEWSRISKRGATALPPWGFRPPPASPPLPLFAPLLPLLPPLEATEFRSAAGPEEGDGARPAAVAAAVGVWCAPLRMPLPPAAAVSAARRAVLGSNEMRLVGASARFRRQREGQGGSGVVALLGHPTQLQRCYGKLRDTQQSPV